MTATDWLSLLVGSLFAGFVVVNVVLVGRVVTHVRLHHPLSGRRFMRRYRREHPVSSRATVEARTPPAALPVARSQTPAGVDVCPATTSAGSIRERHVG